MESVVSVGYGVEVISREIIRPSSETPLHLRNLKLSFFDQLQPPLYISLVFFYEADDLDHDIRSTNSHILTLKKSFLKTLTSFYPLAGKLDKDGLMVECCDVGAEFVVAQVHARLIDVIQDNNDIQQFNQYLPVDPVSGIHGGHEKGTLLAVQINLFECGGMAVVVCCSHNIADGTSVVNFMKVWAGENKSVVHGQFSDPSLPPVADFGLVSRHFPVRNLSDVKMNPSLVMGSGNVLTKTYVFDKEKLEALKHAATEDASADRESDFVKNPTRVELVSAFMWKHFIENNHKNNPSDKKITTFAALHAVNLRSRTSPCLGLENAFGNFYATTIALIPKHEYEATAVPKLGVLVSKLRQSIRRIDDKYIKEAANNGDNYLNDLINMFDMLSEGETDCCLFSSWCRFPVYDMDFGWGNPVWVTTTLLPVKNITILGTSKSGDGIEVWVNMVEEDIQTFETQFKLLGTIAK